MATAQHILDRKGSNIWWIDPLESVFEAMRMMHEYNCGALLVMIDDNLVGIVSERDYVRKVILDHKASKQTKVSEIMTRDLIKVTPDDTVEHCLDLMKNNHIRHLPVVKDGEVAGVISLRDLFLEVIEIHVASRGQAD